MAIGGPNRAAIAATSTTTQATKQANGGLRNLSNDASQKLSGTAAKLEGLVPSDKPITQGALKQALEGSGLSPELQNSIVGLAPADTAGQATQPAAQNQIAASTAQSKSAGFDTGFGLFGAGGKANNDIQNQIEESSNKLDGWDDTAAIS